MFTRWHTPAPIPVIIDTPSRSHWLDPNPQDDPSESLFSQRPFGAGEFNQLARLLEDSHYMQSEMSPLDDLLLLQRYPESKHVYTCMARTMTRQEILNALSYIGAYKEEFDKRATQLLQRDHAHSVEYLKGVDYGGDPQNTIHYRTLIVPGGLDPTRHFGFEYTGVVPTRHYEFSQTRLSHACCAQPKGSPGCWISLDPDDIDMEITPYKLWYDLHSYHDLIHMNNDHLVNVISNGSQIGTAFLCAKTYIDLHNRIQTLLLELRDGLASMYRTKNHDAINLDSFLELLEAVRKFNAPQHICTVPWTRFTAEAHLIHIMKLGRTVVEQRRVVELPRRTDPKPIGPRRTDPKPVEPRRTEPKKAPVVKSIPQKVIIKREPERVPIVIDPLKNDRESLINLLQRYYLRDNADWINRINRITTNDDIIAVRKELFVSIIDQKLGDNQNIKYTQMRNEIIRRIRGVVLPEIIEFINDYNKLQTLYDTITRLQKEGQDLLDEVTLITNVQKNQFSKQLYETVNNGNNYASWEQRLRTQIPTLDESSILERIKSIWDRPRLHNDALLIDLKELEQLPKPNNQFVLTILNNHIEELRTTNGLDSWWNVFERNNTNVATYRADMDGMRLDLVIIKRAPLSYWQNSALWSAEAVGYIALQMRMPIKGDASVQNILNQILLLVTPEEIKILKGLQNDILSKLVHDSRLDDPRAELLRADILQIENQLNQSLIDINRVIKSLDETKNDKNNYETNKRTAIAIQEKARTVLQELQDLRINDELDRIEEDEQREVEEVEAAKLIVDPLEAVLSALVQREPDDLLSALISIEDETTNKALIRGFLALDLADINYGMLKEALENRDAEMVQNMLECVNDETLNEHMALLLAPVTDPYELLREALVNKDRSAIQSTLESINDDTLIDHMGQLGIVEI